MTLLRKQLHAVETNTKCKNAVELLPLQDLMLCNKEFQIILLSKNGILISHFATDSINEDAPHPQFTLTSCSSRACHCCLCGKPVPSVSKWSRNSVWFYWKNPDSWEEKRNSPSFCDFTHCRVTNCIDINSRMILKGLPRNKVYYSCA